MDKLKVAMERIAPLAQSKLNEHPFIKSIFESRNLSKAQYAGFLVEIYHLINQTPHYLTYASTFCWEDEWLRDWYMDFAIDERGHDKLCLSDLRKMGLNDKKMTAPFAKNGSQAMIANNFFVASRCPIGLIGFAMATEGMGSAIAADAAAIIESEFDFGSNVCSFLKVHGAEDIEHFERVKEAFNLYSKEDENFELIVRVWEYTITNYSQLFTDAMNSHLLIES